MFDFLSQSTSKVLQKTAKLKSEGKIDRAISLLEKAARDDQSNLQVQVELGSLYFHSARYKAACTLFKRAQRQFPSAESELISLTESLHYESGKPVESAELLLDIYAHGRNLEQGERILSSLTDIQLRSIAERYTKMYQNLVKHPTDSTERTVTLAYSLVVLYSTMRNWVVTFDMLKEISRLSATESGAVLREAERIAAKEWGNALLLISLADLYADAKLLEKAADHYVRALESDASVSDEVATRIENLLSQSESPILLRTLTQMSISSGRFEKALELIPRLRESGASHKEITHLYAELARLDPSSPAPHILLGDHFSLERRWDSAATEYVKAAELSSGETRTIAERLRKILKEDPGNEYLLDAAFDLSFPSADSDTLAALLEGAYASNGALDRNIAEKLNKMLERDISNLKGLKLLGRIHLDRGQWRKAAQVFSYLVDIGEEGARTALPLLKELVRKEPNLVHAKIALSDTFFVLRDFDKALQLYFRTLDSRPRWAPKIVPKIDALLREKPALALSAARSYGEKDYLDPFIRDYAKGEALALAGHYAEAVDDFRRCVEYRPDLTEQCIAAYQRILDSQDNPTVRLAMGDAYLTMGRFPDALAQFNRAASLDAGSVRPILKRLFQLRTTHDAPWLRTAIIDTLVGNHLYTQAVKEIRAAREKFPSHSGHFNLVLARVHQDTGLFEETVTEADQAMDKDHSLAPLVTAMLEVQKRMDKATLPCLVTLAKAYRFSKEFTKAADELTQIAEDYPEKTDWAVDELKTLSEEDPTNPKLSYLQGRLLLLRGTVDEAVGTLSKAGNLDRSYLEKIEGIYATHLQHASEDSSVLLALARVKVARDSLEEATHILEQLRTQDPSLRGPVVRELRKIMEKNPKSVQAAHTLAALYLEEGEFDSALDLLDRLMDLSAEELPWVIEQLQFMRKADPRSTKCRRSLGYAYLKMGNLKKSCEMYDSLLKLGGRDLSRALADLTEMSRGFPESPQVLFLHARMLAGKERVEDSCQAFRQLVNSHPSLVENVVEELESLTETHPQSEFPYLLLAELNQREGEHERSLKDLQNGLRHVQHSRDIMETHMLLAHAYTMLRQTKQARKHLKMAKTKSQSKDRFFRRLRELQHERAEFDVTTLRASLLADPGDDSVRLRLASRLRWKGDLHQALEVLRIQMTTPSGRKKRAVELSLCLAEIGELLTAVEVLRSVGLNTPHDEEDLAILYALAIIHKRMGNHLSAVASLKTIRETDPSYRDAQTLLKQEYEELVLQDSGMSKRIIPSMLSQSG